MARPKSKPQCHPEKTTHGNGLCVNCYHNKRAKDNPDKYKKYQRMRLLKGTHGLTLDDYDGMLEKQNYGCAICGESNGNRVMFVDHDHETGKIRGLLCARCNSAIGLFDDDIKKMAKAIEYITGSTITLSALFAKEI